MTDNAFLLDGARGASLHDDGLPNYLAATLIDRDGQTHYALIDTAAFGDRTVQLNPAAACVGHELPGMPLPLEICRRLTIASRKHLDERPEE